MNGHDAIVKGVKGGATHMVVVNVPKDDTIGQLMFGRVVQYIFIKCVEGEDTITIGKYSKVSREYTILSGVYEDKPILNGFNKIEELNGYWDKYRGQND